MSTCICLPWRGYHRAECPCQAAYEGHRAELADLTEDEIAAGRALVADGWVQLSRKYRRVMQLPSQGTALSVLEGIDPGKVRLLRERMEHALECEARSTIWALHLGETRELDPRAFAAFRKAVK